jgi:hypothetical protein
MEDLRDKSRAGENALETLMRKIPGFGGYFDRERRRDTDKIQREFLARRVGQLKSEMQGLQEEILSSGNLSLVELLDRVSNKLDRVIERLRHASYGQAGFFDVAKVNEAELDRLYEFDLSLVTGMSSAEEALMGLRSVLMTGGEDAAARLADFRRRVEELDASLDERERILKGVG